MGLIKGFYACVLCAMRTYVDSNLAQLAQPAPLAKSKKPGHSVTMAGNARKMGLSEDV